MLKTNFLLITLTGVILFLLLCPAAFAQDTEESYDYSSKHGYSGVSLGLFSGRWPGLGFNYLAIGEDSSAGYNFGIGYVGATIGPVIRTGSDHCFILNYSYYWISYTYPYEPNGDNQGVQLTYGNIPEGSGDLIWDVGFGIFTKPHMSIMLGIGWAL